MLSSFGWKQCFMGHGRHSTSIISNRVSGSQATGWWSTDHQIFDWTCRVLARLSAIVTGYNENATWWMNCVSEMVCLWHRDVTISERVECIICIFAFNWTAWSRSNTSWETARGNVFSSREICAAERLRVAPFSIWLVTSIYCIKNERKKLLKSGSGSIYSFFKTIRSQFTYGYKIVCESTAELISSKETNCSTETRSARLGPPRARWTDRIPSSCACSVHTVCTLPAHL